MFKLTRFLSALALSVCFTQTAAAATSIVFTETAAGVEVTGSGSIDLTGLDLFLESVDTSESLFHTVNPNEGFFGFGGTGNADFYSPVANPSFGTSSATRFAPGTGDYFAVLFGGGPVIGVSAGYVSGESISFSNLIASQTFSSLGITAAPVTFTLGNGDTVNLSFNEVAAVPLPAAGAMLMFGLGALGAARRRRKAK